MAQKWKKWGGPLVSNAQAQQIESAAYNNSLAWDRCCSTELQEWLKSLAVAGGVLPEYVLHATLPVIAALVGPTTQVAASTYAAGKSWKEMLNTGVIILGPSGSGKSPAFSVAVRYVCQEFLFYDWVVVAL